jgi:hypothetical protein
VRQDHRSIQRIEQEQDDLADAMPLLENNFDEDSYASEVALILPLAIFWWTGWFTLTPAVPGVNVLTHEWPEVADSVSSRRRP